MTNDRYDSFDDLRRHQRQGVDYRIAVSDVGSRATILAPHGGGIEPRTSRIARRIAGSVYNCYRFEGIKPSGNRRLHITSHRFDEPSALDLVSGSDVVVVVHACGGEERRVLLGGRDRHLKAAIAAELTAAGIDVCGDDSLYPGRHPDNLCNRGRTRQGAQLELTRGLRDHAASVERLTEAVRTAIARVLGRGAVRGEIPDSGQMNPPTRTPERPSCA